MIVGKDFIYARKNAFGIVYMFLDEECKNAYVNSAIYNSVCEKMKDIKPESVEMITL